MKREDIRTGQKVRKTSGTDFHQSIPWEGIVSGQPYPKTTKITRGNLKGKTRTQWFVMLLPVASSVQREAIVSATWLPTALCCQQYPTLSFNVALDMLEISHLNEVKWRVHLLEASLCPSDWRSLKDSQPGLVMEAIALSINYSFDREEAA